jgi:hypothetical protein
VNSKGRSKIYVSILHRAMIKGLEVLSIISSVINSSTRELTVNKQLHTTICNMLMSAGDSAVIANITKGVYYYTFATTKVYCLATVQRLLFGYCTNVIVELHYIKVFTVISEYKKVTKTHYRF